MPNFFRHAFPLVVVLLVLASGVSACNQTTAVSDGRPANGAAPVPGTTDHPHPEIGRGRTAHPSPEDILTLPHLAPLNLGGKTLRVVATTSIIGDVVWQVGKDAIDLTTLIQAGQDPHSYIPAARDLTAVAEAQVIFINGWNLEQGLVDDLRAISETAPLVPVSANLTPLAFGFPEATPDGQAAEQAPVPAAVDPHTWFSIQNVEQWVDNIEQILSSLDPTNAAIYKSNAAVYRDALRELETYVDREVARIPPEKRILVTNHDSLEYFARDYGFEIIGTVLPAASTAADPSANDLADLIAVLQSREVCTVFTETTASDRLAAAVAAELQACEAVRLPALYTGSLGPPGSDAESYISMFRSNVDQIVAGLTPYQPPDSSPDD